MRVPTALALALGLCLSGPGAAYELDADPFWTRVSAMMPPQTVATIRDQIKTLPEESRALQLRASIWQSLGRSDFGSSMLLQQQLMLDTVANYRFVGAPCDGLSGFDLWSRGEGTQAFRTMFVLAAFMDNFLRATALDEDVSGAETASPIMTLGADRFRLMTLPNEAGPACFIEKLEN